MKIKMLAGIALALSMHAASAAQPFSRVLIVLPGVDYLSLKDGGKHPTGFFLNELATPLMALSKLGVEVEIATPGGVAPTMDAVSDKASWFGSQSDYEAAKTLVASLPGLKAPRSLESLSYADLNRFDGLFVPGGHATMEDLPKSEAMGRVLRYFHIRQKPTALICHGPAALLSAVSNGEWAYTGYKMTVFSKAEEQIEENSGALGGLVTFYVEDSLRAKGAQVEAAAPWTSHALRDRELITGQNPMSDKAVADLLIEALVTQKVKNVTQSASLDLGGAKVFDVLKNKLDWNQGYTTFYVGIRKADFPASQFGERLKAHIHTCKSAFGAAGLQGYLVIATPNYEIAFQNWTTEAAMSAAFAKSGALIAGDAGSFMDGLVFKGANSASELPKTALQ